MQFPSRKARVALLAGVGHARHRRPGERLDGRLQHRRPTCSRSASTAAPILTCSSAAARSKFNGVDPTRDGADAVTTAARASVDVVVDERADVAPTTSTCAASRRRVIGRSRERAPAIAPAAATTRSPAPSSPTDRPGDAATTRCAASDGDDTIDLEPRRRHRRHERRRRRRHGRATTAPTPADETFVDQAQGRRPRPASTSRATEPRRRSRSTSAARRSS